MRKLLLVFVLMSFEVSALEATPVLWDEVKLYAMAQWCLDHDYPSAAMEYYNLAYRWYGNGKTEVR
jgi:hypothetical protein